MIEPNLIIDPNFPKILTSHFPDLKIFPKFWHNIKFGSIFSIFTGKGLDLNLCSRGFMCFFIVLLLPLKYVIVVFLSGVRVVRSRVYLGNRIDQTYFENLPLANVLEVEIAAMRAKYTGIPDAAWPLVKYWTKDPRECSENICKRRDYIK